jgi:SAM-dependent methyltransferase
MVMAPDFDRRASTYGSRADLQRDAAGWVAEWLPAECGSPALELGAGTGFFTAQALRSAGFLVATDKSPRMVEAGRTALPQARWIVADAANPPRQPEPYRTILTCSLVQWLPDPASTFRAWHNVASPGALLLGGWFVRGTMEALLDICPQVAPFFWRSRHEWESLLADAGWRIERSETRNFQVAHVSSADMLRDMHDVGAVVPRRMGAGRLRAALRDNDRKNLAEGRILTTFACMRVQAIRA